MKDIIELQIVEKFNPYHGKDGRFTGPGGATSFTFGSKSKAQASAIQREKERTSAMNTAKPEEKKPEKKKPDKVAEIGRNLKVGDKLDNIGVERLDERNYRHKEQVDGEFTITGKGTDQFWSRELGEMVDMPRYYEAIGTKGEFEGQKVIIGEDGFIVRGVNSIRELEERYIDSHERHWAEAGGDSWKYGDGDDYDDYDD